MSDKMVIGCIRQKDDGINGTRCYIQWMDGEREDLHCGDTVTLVSNRVARVECKWDGIWYLKNCGGLDINSAIVQKTVDTDEEDE